MKNILKKKAIKNTNLLSHIVIAVLTCGALVFIMQWDKGLFESGFREGDIALRDIYAPYNFTIKGDIDSDATEKAKKEATGKILPIFTYEPSAEENVLKKLTGLMGSIGELPGKTPEDMKVEIKKISAEYNLSEVTVESVLGIKDIKKFLEDTSIVLKDIMSEYIVSVSDHEALSNKQYKGARLRTRGIQNEEVVDIGKLFTFESIKRKIEDASAIIKDKKERPVAKELINAMLNINAMPNKEELETEIRTMLSGIEPIYRRIEVKKNEIIINKGERIGKLHIAKLKGIHQNESQAMRLGNIFAISILVGLFILLLSLYIRFYDTELVKGNKEMVLLAVICVSMILTSKIIIASPWPSNLVPVSVASMLIAVLINSRLALVTTCVLSVLVGMISGNRLDITGVSLVGGIIGIFAMRGVRRRSQILQAGLSVGCANMSYFIAMGLIRALDFNTYITESLFGLANGIMSAIIVAGILPFFENIFKISTDISLLELADLNHPLLKEMVIKAPGTYHHSLVVGNLAEAACEAIGANSLLARVGSYFHDIGKLEKSSYFSENQGMGESSHDKLSPTMSSLIITSHVKNGVEMAKNYKLNKKIIDIINQHHGTGVVFYFFKRALEKIKNDEEVGEQSFRYPGPKPQTKEAASVLLADSVEAASRSLDDPTPSRVKGLVRKIINNKFIDGQLDECDLTLSDLEKIAGIFTHILTGIFHTRVEYPDQDDATTQKR
ncbi:MAG: HDIG domain-containing metalloprotein [Candidatus Omnitrophota bacterium]